jgi:hypothetical protein
VTDFGVSHLPQEFEPGLTFGTVMFKDGVTVAVDPPVLYAQTPPSERNEGKARKRTYSKKHLYKWNIHRFVLF